MKKALAVALLSLVLVPQAFGHAEITPQKVPADSLARLVLHLEGEKSVPAVKVAVQLPLSLTQVTFERMPGWKRAQSGRVVTWSGGRIAKGDFAKFILHAHMPAEAGAALLFPTVQTYADGMVVRWIGAEGSQTPAPLVLLTGANQPNPSPPPVVTTASTGNKDDFPVGLTILLAILIAVGTVGLFALRRVLLRSLD